MAFINGQVTAFSSTVKSGSISYKAFKPIASTYAAPSSGGVSCRSLKPMASATIVTSSKLAYSGMKLNSLTGSNPSGYGQLFPKYY